MNRMQQLKRYRQMNERKRIIEEARERFRKKQLSQKPTTIVQELRKSALLSSMCGNCRS